MKKITVFFMLALFFTLIGAFPFTGPVAHAENTVQNLDVIDADIRDIFRSLGELGGYNVLLDKQVQGNISLKITNPLSVKETIELLAQTYGYTFRWVNGNSTVIIGNKDTFSSFDNRFTRVYRLNYASVDQAAEALKVVVPIEQIGKDTRANQLTIRGSLLEHENIEEIIKHIDREVPQVNIDARIEEVTQTAKEQLGFSQGMSGGYDTNKGGWYLNPGVSLNMLEEKSEARMLANPNVSTTDNQEGYILIGDKIPIITSTQTDKGTTYTVSYIDVGTKLRITPRINSDNIVTVTIHAEVSDVKEWHKLPTGDEIPLIETREASSVIRLKDGNTFALSGLIKQDKTVKETGTPYLSKVPILGWFFKGKTTDPNQNREIVIFITPHIVRTDNGSVTTTTTSGSNSTDTVKTGTETKTEAVQDTKKETPAVADNTKTNTTPATDNGKTESTSATTGKTETTPADTGSTNSTSSDSKVTAASTDDTSVKPEDAPAPPPEPIQVVIDDKTNTTNATTDSSGTKTNSTITTSTTDTSATLNNTAMLTPDLKEIQYTVKKEDNIYQISKKFGVEMDMIVKRNGLNSKDSIKVGQTLVIPIPASHLYQIKPKETLWRIAKRYGTTVDLLTEINGLSNSTQIKSGQYIILPTVADKVVNADY